MIDEYRGLLAQCPTVNQVHRLHITLESLFTPAELLSTWQEVCVDTEFWRDAEALNTRLDPATLRTVCTSWLEKLKGLHDLSGKPDPEPYLRRELTKTVILFSDGRPPDGKTLLVCFCGTGHRPMMPAMTFIQCLDASRTDFALLRDLPFQAFIKGLAPLADTLDGLQKVLPKMLRFQSYRRIVVLGISGGGIASMLSALHWDSPVAISVGPNRPTSPRWTRESGEHAGIDLQRARKSSKTERLIVLYGAQSPRDKVAAEALSEFVPVELVEVSDPQSPVHHNALYPILRQGYLPEFLDTTYALTAP